MSEKSNEIKHKLLGEPIGTATAKLRKKILFKLVQDAGLDICFQCKQKIETIDDFSIEHKASWQYAKNPKEAFYDLDNIAFSHLHCNITTVPNRKTPHFGGRGENCPMSKITAADVAEIRKKLATGNTLAELGREYSLDDRAIAAIRDNRTWVGDREA